MLVIAINHGAAALFVRYNVAKLVRKTEFKIIH